MRSSQLTMQQAEKLKDQIAMRLRYFNKLVERMTKLGFPAEDELFQAAVHARAKVQDLHLKAHYAGCKHGVGKKDDGWPDDIARRA